jgi:hypothetical protein
LIFVEIRIPDLAQLGTMFKFGHAGFAADVDGLTYGAVGLRMFFGFEAFAE